MSKDTKLFQMKVTTISTLFQVTKAKLKLDVVIAKEVLNTLRVKYEMAKEQVKALVSSHRKRLNQKVNEALARGWNKWATQSVELQIF